MYCEAYTNMVLYILTFCRVVIGLTFAVSSGSKVLNISKFRQAMLSFHLLPRRLSDIAAIVFLCCEFIVTGFVAIGGKLLLPGFYLAIILLLIFSGALASVLVRRLSLPCNCFGPSEKLITYSDVWRNVGFILCALVGCAAFILIQHTSAHLETVEGLITGLGASAFVIIWIQLGEIMQIFHKD